MPALPLPPIVYDPSDPLSMFPYPSGILINIQPNALTTAYPSLKVRVGERLGGTRSSVYAARWVEPGAVEGSYEAVKGAMPLAVKVSTKSLQNEMRKALEVQSVLEPKELPFMRYWGSLAPGEFSLEVGTTQSRPVQIGSDQLAPGERLQPNHYVLLMDQHKTLLDLAPTLPGRSHIILLQSLLTTLSALHSAQLFNGVICPGHILIENDNDGAEKGYLIPGTRAVLIGWDGAMKGMERAGGFMDDSTYLSPWALLLSAQKIVLEAAEKELIPKWSPKELKLWSCKVTLATHGEAWDAETDMYGAVLVILNLYLQCSGSKERGQLLLPNPFNLADLHDSIRKGDTMDEYQSVCAGMLKQHAPICLDRTWIPGLQGYLMPLRVPFSHLLPLPAGMQNFMGRWDGKEETSLFQLCEIPFQIDTVAANKLFEESLPLLPTNRRWYKENIAKPPLPPSDVAGTRTFDPLPKKMAPIENLVEAQGVVTRFKSGNVELEIDGHTFYKIYAQLVDVDSDRVTCYVAQGNARGGLRKRFVCLTQGCFARTTPETPVECRGKQALERHIRAKCLPGRPLQLHEQLIVEEIELDDPREQVLVSPKAPGKQSTGRRGERRAEGSVRPTLENAVASNDGDQQSQRNGDDDASGSDDLPAEVEDLEAYDDQYPLLSPRSGPKDADNNLQGEHSEHHPYPPHAPDNSYVDQQPADDDCQRRGEDRGEGSGGMGYETDGMEQDQEYDQQVDDTNSRHTEENIPSLSNNLAAPGVGRSAAPADVIPMAFNPRSTALETGELGVLATLGMDTGIAYTRTGEDMEIGEEEVVVNSPAVRDPGMRPVPGSAVLDFGGLAANGNNRADLLDARDGEDVEMVAPPAIEDLGMQATPSSAALEFGAGDTSAATGRNGSVPSQRNEEESAAAEEDHDVIPLGSEPQRRENPVRKGRELKTVHVKIEPMDWDGVLKKEPGVGASGFGAGTDHHLSGERSRAHEPVAAEDSEEDSRDSSDPEDEDVQMIPPEQTRGIRRKFKQEEEERKYTPMDWEGVIPKKEPGFEEVTGEEHRHAIEARRVGEAGQAMEEEQGGTGGDVVPVAPGGRRKRKTSQTPAVQGPRKRANNGKGKEVAVPVKKEVDVKEEEYDVKYDDEYGSDDEKPKPKIEEEEEEMREGDLTDEQFHARLGRPVPGD